MGHRPSSHRRRPRPVRPGAAPGSFELPEGGDSAIVRAIRFSAARFEERVLSAPEEVAELGRSGEVVWLDINGLERRWLDAVAERFGLHPLAVEDAVHTHQRAKVEAYPDHELLIARMVSSQAGELVSEQVAFFVGAGFVVTIQERPGDPFDPVRERLRTGRGQVRQRGADYLAYALLDAIVDHYFPLLEELGDHIELLEEEITTAPSDDHLHRIQELRRTLITFRRATWPLRDAVQSLARGEIARVEPETRVFLRDTLDHLLRIVDVLESYRDMAGGLMDLHLSMVSARMNQVMQVLTVISTIFIPLTFIAGVYGMNFEDMPETHLSWGYPAALVLMAVIGAALFVFFWRRGWIGAGRRRRRSGAIDGALQHRGAS